jgi:hypothetical protein
LRLKIRRIDRDDAWEMFRLADYYGGVEVDDGCIAFPSEEQCRRAFNAIRLGFGNEYVEVVEVEPGSDSTRGGIQKPR